MNQNIPQTLFAGAHQEPLAARMRPRTLDEFIGQHHLLGPGRLLRRAILADQLSSLIFYGPPGTGKTTLARVIANSTKGHFTALNAVLSGVKDIREAVKDARERLQFTGQRTILFIDEVHRFNKAQQDALLPWVENGTVILIGATTENPYFEVNKALVSRSRVFQLKPLEDTDLHEIALQALRDDERGYGTLAVELDEEALEHLVNVANGDARAILNALELAVETTPATEGTVHVTLEVAEESIQRRAVLYDKEGDAHFDAISAFIKSVRGSDPDAALYWMAKMVYAGEDPRFILRRLLILACEDIGLADPNALSVVVAAAQAFDYVGLPEGRFMLSQAALYLATAPKSNSTLAFFDALAAVEREREAEMPNHLKDGNRDSEGFGHGQGYLYPHAYRDHWVAQQYLPAALQGRVFYQPSDQGFERDLRDAVARRREAQLAAMLEPELTAPLEVLTTSPRNAQKEQWLERTIGNVGERLGALRDEVMELARLQRHQLVMDLHAASGLLTWEALRRVPEGQVWSVARSEAAFKALSEQAQQMDELERPVVLAAGVAPGELGRVVREGRAQLEGVDPEAVELDVFDVLLGRNALSGIPDMPAALAEWRGLLARGGALVLAETVPSKAQRLYALIGEEAMEPALWSAWRDAEEALYTAAEDPNLRWGPDDLRDLALACGFEQAEVKVRTLTTKQRLGPELIERWFTPSQTAQPSYVDHLRQTLEPEQIASIRALFERRLVNQLVPWQTTLALLRASTAP
ncbi:MAG: AAA family ATPase [Trueperaceae bacterium]|nr:MAG: AAA family ATPase [Trueperaceae bacterium]